MSVWTLIAYQLNYGKANPHPVPNKPRLFSLIPPQNEKGAQTTL